MKSFPVRLLPILILMALMPAMACAEGDLPYMTYNYDYWSNVTYTPAAYVPDLTLRGTDFELSGQPIGPFLTPQDMCIAPSGEIYVADTGNNRIVVLDGRMQKAVRIIESFDNFGLRDTFSSPFGVAVSQKGRIYIADSQNKRIVILNADGTLSSIVLNPQSEVLEDGFVFIPLKVSVDYADRIYCIAQKMFEGIMVFENGGQFTGFFGTIQVKISLWEKFWRKIATKEERSKQQLFIPTEFTGIDIDDEGFVYASNVDTDGLQAVRRLNPRGQDVILKGANKNLGGDLWIGGFTMYAGPSKIVDVVYRGKGIYSLLDAKRGRVFTYDHEGNLLYIFGGLGTQAGTFTTPVAIEEKNGELLVLDAYQASILTFASSEYGSLINEAVGLRFDGDEKQAVEKWERVLRMDENNELANTGIGKAYLAAGDNEQAMLYLKRGMNKAYYSVAFKRYRNEWFKKNMNWILSGAIILAVMTVLGLRTLTKRRKLNGMGRKAA
jgi:DNA-binding beta-propeller fold protein YncE